MIIPYDLFLNETDTDHFIKVTLFSDVVIKDLFLYILVLNVIEKDHFL